MSPRSLTNWTKHWNKLSRHTPPRGPVRRTRRPLWLELLEDRVVLAAFTVNTLQDTLAVNLTTGQDSSGNVSLRFGDHGGEPPGRLRDDQLRECPDPERYGDRSDARRTFAQRLQQHHHPGAGRQPADHRWQPRLFGLRCQWERQLGGAKRADDSNGNASSGNASSGGGICDNGSQCTVTVTNCTLSGNSAYDGGGIYVQGGMLMVSNSTLSGNTAAYGGGIYSTGSTTIVSSTFSGNSSSGSSSFGGGGILSLYGPVSVSGSTFSGNSDSGEREAPFTTTSAHSASLIRSWRTAG